MSEQYNFSLKKELVEELTYVVKKMRAESIPFKKIYYFSAAYGAFDRAVRLRYDPYWIILTQNLQNAHTQFQARAIQLNQGDGTIPVTNQMLDELADIVEQIAVDIQKDKKSYDALERLADLGYQTTGGGYYVSTRDTERKLKPSP